MKSTLETLKPPRPKKLVKETCKSYPYPEEVQIENWADKKPSDIQYFKAKVDKN
jgi:hypothetical protein